MDELSALIEKLQKEVTGLEQALRLREAEEGARLRGEEANLRASQSRLERARALLAQEATALLVVDEQRKHLLERIENWRGQLWRIGYGSAVVAALTMALTSFSLAWMWFPRPWAIGWLAVQGLLFGVLYLLIPEKR